MSPLATFFALIVIYAAVVAVTMFLFNFIGRKVKARKEAP